ncbi:MAG: protease modulator HflC [Pseudomonadota bacterium]
MRMLPIFLAIFLALASSSVYVVNETERAVKLKFKQLVEADLKPGLGFKIPFVHEVVRFDARNQTATIPSQGEYITKDQKQVLVDSYLVWRVSDVKKYYTSTSGSSDFAAKLLISRASDDLRTAFSNRDLSEAVSGERNLLMQEVQKAVDGMAQQKFGINVVDVRVKQIELSRSVLSGVYDRMRAERIEEANDLRAQGKATAEGIEADADRQKIVSLAEGYNESQKLRGEGDAQAAQTYAKAYGKNPEFYEFYRSLLAYENSFAGQDDTILLSPDSEFFDYFRSVSGKD